MGRLAKELKLTHTAEDLKICYQKCNDVIECRRIQVIWLLAEGREREDVQAVTAFSDWSIRNIITRYNEGGLLGLKDKRHSNCGAPMLLDEQELLLLDQVLQKPPAKGGRWNGRKVATWIKENIGKEISLRRCYDYLKKLEFSLQTPRPRHKLADASEQEIFKKKAFT